jgi:NAD(P)H-hydrate epimerase
MELLTTEEMRAVEADAINNNYVPSLILMENAARGAAEQILKLKPKRVAVIAGGGNNGGDGLAIARQLLANNANVLVFFVGSRDRATADCLTNLNALENYTTVYTQLSEDALSGCNVIVDALIGTGLKKELSDKYKALTSCINAANGYVVSVDCPTGINSDTGCVMGSAVCADLTVTFHQPKIGLFLSPACDYVGIIKVAHIGIPISNKGSAFTLEPTSAATLLPKRCKASHKGSFGSVLLISGSELMSGAALMNTRAAYRVGAGLVRVCTTPNVIAALQADIAEAVTAKRSDITSVLELKHACVAIGSGLGVSDSAYELLRLTLEKCTSPLIIDGDALTLLSTHTELLDRLNPNIILTPHIKEMSRLSGLSVVEVAADTVSVAREFSTRYNVTVMLKSARTVIASPNERICVNTTGNSALAKAGSGDTLVGAVAGLVAQGVGCYDAACLGAYLCGLAGEICSQESTEYGAMATEVADKLPQAIACALKEAVKD